MRYGTLGKAELHISKVGLGTWALVGDSTWGPQEESDSLATLRAAYDEGVRFFDTAPAYGDGLAERLVGKALGDVRSLVCIASKVSAGDCSPDRLRASCDASLKNLDTSYIDLLQVHWPNRKFPAAEVFGTLDRLKEEGKIRDYGVCNYGPQDLSKCLAPKRFPIASNQLAYSLLFRAIEFEILPACRREQIDVLAYCPLMQGLLTGKFQHADAVPAGRARTRLFSSARAGARHDEPGAEAEVFAAIDEIQRIARELGEPMASVSLSWLLAQPGVACAVVGARTAYQARRNARGGNLVLPPGIVKELATLTEPLKTKLGPNADLWQTASRIR